MPNKVDLKMREVLFDKLQKGNKLTHASAMVYVRNIVRLHKIAETQTSILKPTWLTAKLISKIKTNPQSRHLFLAGVKLLQALGKKSGKRWDQWYSQMINSTAQLHFIS